ncbi:MAG TPA: response regulator [Pseudacidobacterium sp.]|jgi:DNA-binding response OmpR family regulator|nr:response regulator [Pseudacidobacterium sp.]
MKRRILLVDDELAVLLTLKAVLEFNGFEVETAASAREAKSKIKNGEFHMVITDMRMESESSGREVVQVAKKASYKPAVAMLTAFPQSDSELEDHGADEMLVKPMNTQDLLVQIEALLVTHEDKKRVQNERDLMLVGARESASTKRSASSRKVAASRAK